MTRGSVAPGMMLRLAGIGCLVLWLTRRLPQKVVDHVVACIVGTRALAGVWDHDGAPLNPNRLPLSPRLRERLARWCARFQWSFEREIDLDAFVAEGRAIARAVKAEQPDWSVVYFDDAAAARRNYRAPPSNNETEIAR